MKIHFLGANEQVTGSRYLLEVGETRVLIDCGLFQERKYTHRNWDPSPFPPKDVDVVLLTHAHLDHCGLLPKFVREGFRGEILSTAPSLDLARIVLEDSARIQVEDAAYKKRRHEREGRRGPHPEAPLYTPDDVPAVITKLRSVRYDEPITLGPGLEARYREAGHILGSAMLEITAEHNGTRRRIVFSADIGQWDRPLLRDPHLFDGADDVIMESTYGDRNHEEPPDLLEAMARTINETSDRGGNLLIPTFAIDRAQELMYLLSQLVHANRIPRMTVFLDSPMALSATAVYEGYPHLFDEEAREMMRSNRHPFQFPGLHFVRDRDESRAINSIRGSCIVLAGSGMCTGGRIKHHLRQNIGRPESTILFVGFQSRGTLGRQILDGSPEVRIHGREYPVRAAVRQISGLSAHADRDGLLRWIDGFKVAPSTLFLTHGEREASHSLAETIRAKKGWNVEIPTFGQTFDLGVNG